MTEKKPAGMNAERWIDQQVREARERGDFDNLPGTGRPLPNIDQPYDELWWAREFIEREKVNILPETLRLRRDIEQFIERLAALPDEADVRLGIRDLNARVLIANSRYVEGPPAPVWPLDEERMVFRWRRERIETSRPPLLGRKSDSVESESPAGQTSRAVPVLAAGIAAVAIAAVATLLLAIV
ncbi:MAG TPA: DUF1992 domain-containing protein [Tepidiformaceae bacterium]